MHFRLNPDDVSFRAGSSYRVSDGVLVNASEIIIHPNYQDDPTDFDVAVVKVGVFS